jgi:hypothetical protein
MQRCVDREFGVHWPYTVTNEGTYYNITRKGEWLALPIHEAIEYQFNPNKISWTVTVTAKNKFSSFSSTYNQTHRMGVVSTQGSPELLEFLWDHQIQMFQTLSDGNISLIEEEIFTIFNENDIEVYYTDDWFNDVDYPVYVVFDSWILNSTEKWNGSHLQTNLDENESITLDIDESIFAPYISYWSMDNFSTSVVFDKNQTNENDCAIFGSSDVVGWRNRSREFRNGANNRLECGNDVSLRVTGPMTYTNIFTLGEISQEWIGGRWADNQKAFVLLILSGNPQFYVSSNGPTTGPFVQGTPMVVGPTYCVVSTYNGTHLNMYVDGIKATPTAFSSDIFPSIANLTIGSDSFGRWANATIDEVGLYNYSFTDQQARDWCNNSYYNTGNFTTDERNTTGTDFVSNVTSTFVLGGGSSLNLYINNTVTGLLQQLCSGCTSGTNYTPQAPGIKNYTIIAELINGNTPHISKIEVHEGAEPPDITPPNLTHQFSANESTFSQSGETVNIPFSVFCTDNVQCDNATLHVFNSTFAEINFTEVHRITEMKLINGTSITGSVSDLEQDDGVYVTVREASAGQPAEFCMDVFFNFTNVPTDHDHTIKVDGRYTGGGAHFTNFGWRNYSAPGEVYVSFANFSKTTQDQQFTSLEINATEMTDGNGNTTIKLVHDDGSCVSGHLMLIDLLELVATNNNKEFTNGFLNFSVPLSAANGTQWWYYFEAWDTSGNNVQFFGGNYTFNITIVGPTITLIRPLNITYQAQIDIPIRMQFSEPEIDTIWYSFDGADNVTITNCAGCVWWPNTSLDGVANGLHTLIVYGNVTSGGEANVTISFGVDFMGLNETSLAEAVWNHNSTERTTNNYFDKVLGGDIMTNEILFFIVLTVSLVIMGFKTSGRANLPFFGFASLSLTAMGLFILDTEPFARFEGDPVGRGLLNITAVLTIWGLAGILTIYAGLGEWRRMQNR